jgi:hypothetical protein
MTAYDPKWTFDGDLLASRGVTLFDGRGTAYAADKYAQICR